MPFHFASRGFPTSRGLALTIAFSVVTLLISQLASAAESRIDALCDDGVVTNESNENGDVAYAGDRVDIGSSAGRLALRARSSVAGGGPALRYCDVTTAFENSVLIDPGTSGLAPGDPVSLKLTVALDGTLSAAYDGSEPEVGPATFTATSRVDARLLVTVPARQVCVPDEDGEYCKPEEVARFDSEAQRHRDGSEPTDAHPDGFLDYLDEWSWLLRGNRGESLGDQASTAGSCDWPGPCVITEPPPSTPDYRGTRTIVVDAFVGDRLEVDGFLAVNPGVSRGTAAARFPDDGADGLRASLEPASGFEGLELTYEITPPEEPPPPPPPSITVSIDDAAVAEGHTGTQGISLSVRLSAPSSGTVSVPYATRNDTATSGDDYAPTSGTVTFAPGEVETTIGVEVLGDRLAEPDESFEVTLGDPTGALVGDGVGRATIEDDDFPDDLPARKRLGELRRAVLGARIAPGLQQDLVSSLWAARRALRGSTPNRALACARIDEFVGKVQGATGSTPSIPESEAAAWIAAARDIQTLLGCS